jgi:hypothetical protein
MLLAILIPAILVVVLPKSVRAEESSSWSDPVFGRYHMRIDVHGAPEFNDGLKYYDELYGDPSRYASFGADYTPWGWFVNFGVGIRGGMYTDNGRTAVSAPDSNGTVTTYADRKTTLTVLPFQFLGVARMTPFPAKWLVLEAYLGRERAYFQEVRNIDVSSASLRAGPKANGLLASGDDDAWTNKGWLNGDVFGYAASILLNPLDEGAVNSMRSALGLGFVYLTIFQEQVKYLEKDRVSFGRKSTGIGFTFETVK